MNIRSTYLSIDDPDIVPDLPPPAAAVVDLLEVDGEIIEERAALVNVGLGRGLGVYVGGGGLGTANADNLIKTSRVLTVLNIEENVKNSPLSYRVGCSCTNHKFP